MRRRGELALVAKVQPYSHLSSSEAVALRREIANMEVLGRYNHPHLVRFRQVTVARRKLVPVRCHAHTYHAPQSFQDGMHLFIIMEHCEQGDLAQLIASQRQTGVQFSERVVQRWLCELVSALDLLHTLKVLHRDIKPQNIFISRGAAKLGDLGLSKEVVTGVTGAQPHTQCGSPLYIAPEVHMGQPYSKSVDIWSLGVTLFEMMMLGHAFSGPDVPEILRNIVHARHAEIVGEWSDDLTRLLLWMLEERAVCRPSTGDIISDGYFQTACQSSTWQAEALKHRPSRALLSNFPDESMLDDVWGEACIAQDEIAQKELEESLYTTAIATKQHARHC